MGLSRKIPKCGNILLLISFEQKSAAVDPPLLFSLNLKMQLAQQNFKLRLYGRSIWNLTLIVIGKLQVLVKTCMRGITVVLWPDKISNEELCRRTGQKNMLQNSRKAGKLLGKS